MEVGLRVKLYFLNKGPYWEDINQAKFGALELSFHISFDGDIAQSKNMIIGKTQTINFSRINQYEVLVLRGFPFFLNLLTENLTKLKLAEIASNRPEKLANFKEYSTATE